MPFRPHTMLPLVRPHRPAALLLALWLLAGIAAIALLQIGTAEGLVSSMLRGLGVADRMAADELVRELREVVLVGALAIPLLSLFVGYLRRPDVADRVVRPATPGDIGAIRMLVCGVLLISVLWEDLASTAALPREMLRPMGIMQIVRVAPGFEMLLDSPLSLRALEWATGAFLLMGFVGWKTRFALPFAAIGYLLVGGILRQYSWFYHTGLIALYLLVVLCLVPSHHGRSLDRLLRIRNGQPVVPDAPTLKYGWARYALWVTMAVPYVAAGLSKLRNGGLTWWEASNFKFILFQSTLRPMEFDFDLSLLLARAPDALFAVLALTAVAGEAAYGLVLFSRRARWVLPTLMLLMHVGILFLQNILFFDLILLQALFFDFRRVEATLERHVAGLRFSRVFRRADTHRLHPVAGSLLASAAAPVAPAGWRLPSMVVVALSVFWVFRVEFYPFTGMQMFSQKRTEPVVYERVLARTASGQTVRAPIERSIRAMSDSRYRRVLGMAFDPDRAYVTRAFLDSVQSRWNRQTSALEDPIIDFEVQRWEWHYVRDPADPAHGTIVERWSAFDVTGEASPSSSP